MDKSIVIHKKAATEFPGLSGGFLPLGKTTLMIDIHIPVTITLFSALIENRKCKNVLMKITDQGVWKLADLSPYKIH